MKAYTHKTLSFTEGCFDNNSSFVRLENEYISVTILPDKGADIYELIYKPKNIDVLWKSPWGIKSPANGIQIARNSEDLWMEYYAGGWQDIFPNGGDSCIYKGAEMSFHGEASIIAWEYKKILHTEEKLQVVFKTKLFRSPFSIEKLVTIYQNKPQLVINEKITNIGGVPIDYMWGQHPVFGAPFLTEDCIIDIGGKALVSDDSCSSSDCPLLPNKKYLWPKVSEENIVTDLSRIPEKSVRRYMMAYLKDFQEGWYAITNTQLELGVALIWPVEIFPYAWFWQEMNAEKNYPWYGNTYLTAIEPFTSIPGQGLKNVIETTGTHKTLKPGLTINAEIRAVFYESAKGIKSVAKNGEIILKNPSFQSFVLP